MKLSKARWVHATPYLRMDVENEGFLALNLKSWNVWWEMSSRFLHLRCITKDYLSHLFIYTGIYTYAE